MKINNKDATSEYLDLVNQPGLMDNVGDAFIDQSKGVALNKNQKLENALMSGFGHGVKGSADQARRAKLAWLEDQNKQIAMLDRDMKISLGKTAKRQADLTNIGADYLIDIKKISNMYGTGDYVGLNELTPLVYNDIAEKYPDLTKKYGKLLHVYGNNMIFEKGKDVKGYNIKDVFEPIIDTLPEEQRRELAPLMSLTARNKFEQSDLMENLTLEEKRANIDNKYSQTNYHNAQADKANYEMNNPKKEKGTIDPKKMEQDLDVLAEQIKLIGTKGEQGGFSRFMSEITPGHVYQLTPEQTQINTLGQLMRGQMFKAFGYRNETEFEQIPSISSNNTVEQNEAIVKQYKNLFLKNQQSQNYDLTDLQ